MSNDDHIKTNSKDHIMLQNSFKRGRIMCRCTEENKYMLFNLPLYRSTNRVLIPTQSFRILVNDRIYEHIKEKKRFGFVTDFTEDPALAVVVDHVFKSHSKVGTIAHIESVERKRNHMNALTIKGIERFLILNVERMGTGTEPCDIAMCSYFQDNDEFDEHSIDSKEREVCSILDEMREILATEDVYLPQTVEEYMPPMQGQGQGQRQEGEKESTDMTNRQRQELFSFALAEMLASLGMAERLALQQSQGTEARLDWLINYILKPHLLKLKK